MLFNSIESRIVLRYLSALLHGEIICPFPDLEKKSKVLTLAREVNDLNVVQGTIILNKVDTGVRVWLLQYAKNFSLKYIYFPRFYTSLCMTDLEKYLQHDNLYPITPAVCKGLHSLVTKITAGHLPNFYDIRSTVTENELATKEITTQMKSADSGWGMLQLLKTIKYLKTVKHKLYLAFNEQILYFAVPGSVNSVKNGLEFDKRFLNRGGGGKNTGRPRIPVYGGYKKARRFLY